jgi:hypothetical protein
VLSAWTVGRERRVVPVNHTTVELEKCIATTQRTAYYCASETTDIFVPGDLEGIRALTLRWLATPSGAQAQVSTFVRTASSGTGA